MLTGQNLVPKQTSKTKKTNEETGRNGTKIIKKSGSTYFGRKKSTRGR